VLEGEGTIDVILTDVSQIVLPTRYGGSVKPENATALMSQPEIDGALVVGASLDPKSFAAIVKWLRKPLPLINTDNTDQGGSRKTRVLPQRTRRTQRKRKPTPSLSIHAKTTLNEPLHCIGCPAKSAKHAITAKTDRFIWSGTSTLIIHVPTPSKIVSILYYLLLWKPFRGAFRSHGK
jgi:hypothetical protein